MSLPDFLIVKSLDIDSVTATISSRARNLKSSTRRLTGQQYVLRMRLEVAPWGYKQARAWLENLQRDGEYFEYTDETWRGGVDKITNGARNAGAETIALTSITGVNVGDSVNFSSHTKLYNIMKIAGNTITLNTKLQADVPASSTAFMANPKGLFQLPPEIKASGSIGSGLLRDLSRINLRAEEFI